MTDGDSTSESYPALILRPPAGERDGLAFILWEAGTVGIEELESGVWRAYFAEPPPDAVLGRLRAAGATRVRHMALAGEDWIARSRSHTRARRIGRLLVRPPWSRARARSGELDIVIDPERAFGTGGHESTRLVLRELARCATIPATVLDIGTGSGILALAALRLGARRAIGLDLDPESVRAASENGERNGLGPGLSLVRGGPASICGRFGLVVANLTRPLLEELAEEIRPLVAPGGRLLLAGFLTRDTAALRSLYGTAGFRASDAAREGEWALVRVERDGGTGD